MKTISRHSKNKEFHLSCYLRKQVIFQHSVKISRYRNKPQVPEKFFLLPDSFFYSFQNLALKRFDRRDIFFK